MKNIMASLIGPAFGLSLDAAAGGGGASAVATPPAAAPASSPAAAAPAAATTPAAAPAKSGFFGGLPKSTVQTKDPADTAKTVAAAEPAAETTTPAAKPSEPAAATTAAVEPDLVALHRPIMGRYKNVKEAEEAMRRSQDEGLRLHGEVKTLRDAHTKEVAANEATITALKQELETARTTPAFKELSKEELETMRKENPSDYADYLVEKNFRDRDAKAAKAEQERVVKERQTRQEQRSREIEQRDIEMRANPEEFPHYAEMTPVMDGIIDKTGGDQSPLTGHPWTAELLYLMALGVSHKQSVKAGKKAQETAAEAAARKAASDAATSAAGNGGDGGGSGSALPAASDAQKEDAAHKAAILASAPRPFFKKG